MNCERIREQIPECLAGRLEHDARERVVEHLESCAGCRAEVAELNAVWRAMESLNTSKTEKPDPAARARFAGMLEAYRAGMGNAGAQPAKPRRVAWMASPVWASAMAASLLLAGAYAGGPPRQP